MNTDQTFAWEPWPELRLERWKETCETLHRWMQVVGKVRLALAPSLNHTWQAAFYLTARGLSTSPLPVGDHAVELSFDLVGHELAVSRSDGRRDALALRTRPVAAFYREVLELLRPLGVSPHLWPTPVEISDPIPLDEDQRHALYEPEQASRFFRVLLQVDLALKTFMGRFQGKQSPSHFFWGGFDLAQTRFSGRPAPLPSDADWLRRECYDRELMSFGFWPGSEGMSDAALYAYAVPEPPGFRDARIRPEAARYAAQAGEFLLPYEAVRRSRAPREAILDFFQSVYDAGAALGRWERGSLDRTEPPPPRHRAPEPAPQPSA